MDIINLMKEKAQDSEEAIKLSLGVGDSLTTIIVGEGNKYQGLEKNDTELSYNIDQYNTNPQEYVDAQIQTHTEYKSELETELNSTHMQFNKMVDLRLNMEGLLGWIPEQLQRLTVQASKLLILPMALSKFKTVKGLSKGNVGYDEFIESIYNNIQEVVQYGETFIDERLGEAQRTPLAENITTWKEAHDEIKHLYSRIIETSEKTTESDREFFYRLYPKERPVEQVDSLVE